MAKAVLIGDCHITDDSRRPSGRKPGYEQEILSKLSFCVQKANELGAPAIQLGDLFSIKSSYKNSHQLVQRIHEIVKEATHGFWVLFGNHDGAHSNFELLDSQPLGALCRMRNVTLLQGKTDDLPGIGAIPYITQFDDGGWEEILKEKYNNFGVDNCELVLTHAPLFPLGQEPGVYASISPDDWSAHFPDVPYVAYGHIHNPHFKFYNSAKTTLFSNAGAISRGSLHQESINRQLHGTVFTGTDFEYFSIPAKAPEEVFLFDEASIKAIKQASNSDFADAVGKVSLSHLTVDQIVSSLREEVSDKNVLTIIETILEEVQ